MFEDQSPIKPNEPRETTLRPIQPNAYSQASPSGGGAVAPDNLPIGGAEPKRALAEDIFSDSSTIPAAESSPRKGDLPQRSVDTPGTSSPSASDIAYSEASLPEAVPPVKNESSSKRKVLVFLLSAVILALLMIAGYLVYRIIQAREKGIVPEEITEPSTDEQGEIVPPPADPSLEEPSAEIPEQGGTEGGVAEPPVVSPETPVPGDVQDEPPSEQEETPSVPEEPPAQEPVQPPPPPPQDTDNDGLTDIDELQIGTNPRVVDTDLDGLDDYTEVRVYHSDPVSRDTDGDSYDDGTEVKNGYNPAGTGKLKSPIF